MTTNPQKIAVHKVESMTTVLNGQVSSNQKSRDDLQKILDSSPWRHKGAVRNNHHKLIVRQPGVPYANSIFPQSPPSKPDMDFMEAFDKISPIVQRSSPPNSNTCQLGVLGVHNDSRYSIFSNINVVDPDYDELISLTYSIFSNISVHYPDYDSLISLS